MGFTNWVEETAGRVRRDGFQGLRDSAYEFWIGVLRRTDQWAEDGLNYYDRDWDVLVILDGMRADALADVADEYDFLGELTTVRSPGSATYEWMQRTFTNEYSEEMARTVYVSGNPFSEQYLSNEDFAALDHVWQYAWSEEDNTLPARPVTDRAIAHGRESDPDRMIVHYMQPHFPSVPEPLGTENRPPDEGWGDRVSWESPWKQVRKGIADPDVVWESYLANLRYVLDDVAILRENVDADRMVVTADHGNARGEWGVYDHPDVPLSVLRDVPWVTVEAEDDGTHEPSQYTTGISSDANERLKHLGYR